MFRKNLTFPKIEEEIIDYWKKNDSFNESKRLSQNREKFIFYDGPPFATGLPHYGHILSGTIKDMVGRFMYQQGYRVDRRFGWDCHGLPVEYEIDKRLKITDRKQVLDMGIDKYNDECKSIVMSYSNEWEHIVTRMGRWIDFKDGYKTMDLSFMESAWYIFKQLFDRNKIYRGYKVMPFSTACKTPLSNFEANQNYKDVSDPSIVLSFPLLHKFRGYDINILVWTTTPWSLPANCALTVNPKYTYVIVDIKGTKYVIHENRVAEYFKDYKVLDRVLGEELLGLEYSQPFDFYENLRPSGLFRIISGDFVSDANGTAIVHCSPAFGEDDYKAFVNSGLINENDEVPCPIDENGNFTLGKYKGVYFKELDKLIIQDIKDRILVNNRIVHSYPFCWRSDTPLIFKLVPNWFIKVKESREDLLRNNLKINWVPEDVKYKRFHNWLEQARDWAVGRNRFWGTPIPIWSTENFDDFICVGSVAELEELSGVKVNDLHRQYVDKIVIKKNGKTYHRVEEVLDCWFESGSVPYSQDHWPFCKLAGNSCSCSSCRIEKSMGGCDASKSCTSNNSSSKDVCERVDSLTLSNDNASIKERLRRIAVGENGLLQRSGFPADFIGEGIDQTRGWFYTLHVLGTLLFDQPAFKNIICFGIVLAEDGKKMSKRLKNYPDPSEIFSKHGADALRMYLTNSPVVMAENLRFSETGVVEIVKTLLIPWYNSLTFYMESNSTFGGQESSNSIASNTADNTNVDGKYDGQDMDSWIKCSFDTFCYKVTETIKKYRLNEVLGLACKFIDDLSNWYIRMNRKQIRNSADLLGKLLRDFSIVMAPIVPFFSEFCYQSITPGGSVHHQMYPKGKIVNHPFEKAKEVIEAIRQLRENMKLKLKRPLKAITIVCSEELANLLGEFVEVIESECNILNITFESENKYSYKMNVKPFFEELKKDLESMKVKINLIRKISEEEAIKLMKNSIVVDGVEIKKNDVLIEKQFSDLDNSLYFGEFGLIFDITIDKEVEEMAEAREFYSFIQKMRKSSGLVVADSVNVDVESENLREIVKKYYKDITFGSLGEKVGESEYIYNDTQLKVNLFKIN